jgi:cell division protein FtsW (lipid II flippase)
MRKMPLRRWTIEISMDGEYAAILLTSPAVVCMVAVAVAVAVVTVVVAVVTVVVVVVTKDVGTISVVTAAGVAPVDLATVTTRKFRLCLSLSAESGKNI